MKNILLLVHDDSGQEARLQAALDITRALEGHLSCVDVSILPILVGDYYGGAEAEAILFADECERETKNKAALEARLANEDVPWDWCDTTGSIERCLQDKAALADLIVLNRKLDVAGPDMRDIVSELLMHARAPILAVPETLKSMRLDRALIAWDGGGSAAATMRASLPLLKRAKDVEIFMAQGSGHGVAPNEAAEYLSRHDVHATVRIVDTARHTPDALIEDEAARWRADYVLMGAYGHGRLRETFGGVTKRMLSSSTLPLILGH
ncbi:universal stress protein [Sphingomonas populi]|uniref:Universal stress protein n=1 Tax=Sphingomonas populi TaxID=2484750 RepID=A0A4Q6XT21_9SPHN|nr:universal stress protein [Sphingomonas populi]RZF63101.1 universal stress protein [Sphingomonas populi]